MICLKWPHSGCQGLRLLWGRFSPGGGLLARFEAAKFTRLQIRPCCRLAKNASQQHYHGWLHPWPPPAHTDFSHDIR